MYKEDAGFQTLERWQSGASSSYDYIAKGRRDADTLGTGSSTIHSSLLCKGVDLSHSITKISSAWFCI